eukprot:2078676-Pleurochrysis_carterae.AAC.1
MEGCSGCTSGIGCVDGADCTSCAGRTCCVGQSGSAGRTGCEGVYGLRTVYWLYRVHGVCGEDGLGGVDELRSVNGLRRSEWLRGPIQGVLARFEVAAAHSPSSARLVPAVADAAGAPGPAADQRTGHTHGAEKSADHRAASQTGRLGGHAAADIAAAAPLATDVRVAPPGRPKLLVGLLTQTADAPRQHSAAPRLAALLAKRRGEAHAAEEQAAAACPPRPPRAAEIHAAVTSRRSASATVTRPPPGRMVGQARTEVLLNGYPPEVARLSTVAAVGHTNAKVVHYLAILLIELSAALRI